MKNYLMGSVFAGSLKKYEFIFLTFLFIVLFSVSSGYTYDSFEQLGAIGRVPVQKSTNSSVTSAATSSSNQFIGFQRYPAEEKTWLWMTDNTAYLRDVLASGVTYISTPANGDRWYATASTGDGTVLTWPSVNFYSNYNRQKNCFVSPYWVYCNTLSLEILWYARVQCQPPGKWTMNFFYNGNQFDSEQFTLWPPNHKLVTVANVSATDSISGLAAINVNAISSEPADADILITGGASQPQVVQLRAKRLGTGPGRVYTVMAIATDMAGNTATATETCTVPHDQGH